MNKFYKMNVPGFKSAIFSLVLVAVFSCSRKDNMVSSNYELQRQRSLELENSQPNGNITENDLAVEASAEEAQPAVTADPKIKLDRIAAAPDKSQVKAEGKEARQNKKIEKIKKLLDKKSVKIKKAMERTSLNQNMKMGLILVLVGIIIAIVLGGLIHPIFWTLGALVIVVGLVFLILGLLEM
jgi:hypothetical protein